MVVDNINLLLKIHKTGTILLVDKVQHMRWLGKRYNSAKVLAMLEETEKALKDPKLQALLKKHVGGRTFPRNIRARNMDRSKGDVLRGPNDNFFSMWYQEGTKYDNDRRNIGAPVPQRLAPPPPLTSSHNTTTSTWKNQWWDFLDVFQINQIFHKD